MSAVVKRESLPVSSETAGRERETGDEINEAGRRETRRTVNNIIN